MSVGVKMPQRQQGDGGLGKLLQIGGAAAGGIVGGLPGAATGASLGGMAGGMMAPQASGGPGAVESGGSAIDRRMQKLSESPQMQIANSIDSLKYIQDDQTRAELAKPLLQADYLARNRQA